MIMHYYIIPGLKEKAEKNSMKAEDILKHVCDFLSITRHDILRFNRKRKNVLSRQIAMYLIRKHTTISLYHIGEIFNNRDHTTVIHAVNTIDDLMFSDDNVKILVKDTERYLFKNAAFL